MVNKKLYKYEPDYAIAPGITLLEVLESMGMTQIELSRRTGKTQKTITHIIKGEAPITSSTAIELERATSIPAKFWNNLESNYREQLAYIEELKALGKETCWLQKLPIKDMVKAGWIKKFEDTVLQLKEVLNFYGVASPEQWKAVWQNPQCAFRKSEVFESNPQAISAWLREGEIRAKSIVSAPYDENKFKKALWEIRSLTGERLEIFEPKLKKICADAGVAVVFVREIPKVRVSGVSRWISKDKALIQLTLRYKTDDNLWFTFFHEAAHILLHGKKMVFIDSNNCDDELESQANGYCSNMLIPQDKLDGFLAKNSFSKVAITHFAREIGITPSIVLGRLQHEGKVLYNTRLNVMKMKLKWKEDAKLN